MLTRKQGPPIPPRPNAIVENKNNRDDSQMSTLNGRTVIYRSPSIELLDKHQYQQENKFISTNNGETTHVENISVTSIMSTNTTIAEKCVTNLIKNNFNNISNSNNNTTVKNSSVINVNINEQSNLPLVASKSPIPRPRLLKPAPTYQLPAIESSNLPAPISTTVNNVVENHSDPERVNNSYKQKVTSQITITSVSNETFNLECTGVDEPNEKYNLSQRTEPDGGETSFTHDTTKTSSMKATVKPPAYEKKVAFHELLISELAAMRNNTNNNHSYVSNSQSKMVSLVETSSPCDTYKSKIRTSDWVEVGDNGREMVLSSCQISLEDSGLEDEDNSMSWDPLKHAEKSSTMSLPGLPPLPKSLSGLELSEMQKNTPAFATIDSFRSIPPIASRIPSTLDTQLAILRREMFGLRQLDLSLLSQLWALNESIQDFRTMLQDQENLSPPSPPSDVNSVTSEEDDDDASSYQGNINRMRSVPPPPPPPTRKSHNRPN